MWSFIISILKKIGLRIKDDEMGVLCCVEGKEMRIPAKFCLEILKERDYLEDLGVEDERVLLKLMLWKQGERVWIGFTSLAIVCHGGFW
jgi:hypothetical protein